MFANLNAIDYSYELKCKVGIWKYKVIVKSTSKWIYFNEPGLEYSLEIYDFHKE